MRPWKGHFYGTLMRPRACKCVCAFPWDNSHRGIQRSRLSHFAFAQIHCLVYQVCGTLSRNRTGYSADLSRKSAETFSLDTDCFMQYRGRRVHGDDRDQSGPGKLPLLRRIGSGAHVWIRIRQVAIYLGVAIGLASGDRV